MNESTAVASTTAILALIHEVMDEFLDLVPEDIHDDRDLKDHGADSIDRVEILVTLKNHLGIETPLAAFAAIPDLRALAQFLLHEAEGRR